MVSKSLKIIFCLIYFFSINRSIGQVQRDEAEQQECVRLWLQKKPDLLERFQRNQVKWLCQRTDAWMQAAVTPTRPVSDFITAKQMEYLTKLQCQGADCIKEIGAKQKKPKSDDGQRKSPTPGWVPSMIGGKKASPTPGLGPSGHSDALADSDAFDVVDENSILNQNPDQCRDRFWLAQTCKFLVNATSPEEVFPEEFNRPKIAGDLRRKMQQRLDNRKSKCQRVRNLLQTKSKSFDDVPNCDDSVLLLTPKQFAERCHEILEYEKSQKSTLAKKAWSFLKKWVGKGATPETDHNYAEWLDRCRQARDRLDSKGMTFQSWLNQFAQKLVPGRRRKRADTPSQAVNVLHNDFADLLAENNSSNSQRAKRKEYRMLTDDERKRYHAAINKMKTDKIDSLSKYDLLVIYHTPQEASGAHWGPSFLPFHREFLKQYEIALRKEDPSVALPYWDTTLDEGLPSPRDSIIWMNDFLGTREGPVVEGPFANWTATQELSMVPGMHQLFRSVGTSPFGGMYKQADIEFMLGREKFDDLTACVDPTFELVHGIVHMFVGGYMADIGIAPNDPAFYMHHNFIDYLWEEFRQTKQTPQQREIDYPAQEKSCNNFHYADSQMKPFVVKNSDGLSNNYTKDIYFYQPRPRCTTAAPDCGSPYLFCDKPNSRCLAKVQPNGNCTGFENSDICYKSVCTNGICATDPTATTVAVPTTTAAAATTTTAVVTTTLAPSTTQATTAPTTVATTPVVTASISTPTPIPTTTITVTTAGPPGPPGVNGTTPGPPGLVTTLPTTTSAILTTIATTTKATTTRSPAPATTTRPMLVTLVTQSDSCSGGRCLATTKAPPLTVPPATTGRPTVAPTTTPLVVTTKVTTATTTIAPTPVPTRQIVIQTFPPTRAPLPTVPTPRPPAPTPVPTVPTARPPSFSTTKAPTPTTFRPSPTARPLAPSPATRPPITTARPPTPAPQPSSVTTVLPRKTTAAPSPVTSKPSFPITYFTVTVVRGLGYYAQPVKNARVKTTGLNSPLGYTQSLPGSVTPDSAYPSYAGACLMKVYDPSKLGAYANVVQFSVEAVDDTGRACRLQCYDQRAKKYADCPQGNRFKISPNQYVSDPIKYFSTERDALEKLWTVSGYYRQRVPDYIMFQCP